MVSLLVETEDLVSVAAAIERRVVDPLGLSLGRLWAVLDGCAAMAGDDPGGLAWASAYDAAARSAHAGFIDVINGCGSLAAMFAQTARNYAAADEASTPGRASAVLSRLEPVYRYGPAVAPLSAAGGSGGPPHGWGLVEYLVGYVWPNGHQDRLHAAAAGWRGSAEALGEASNRVTLALLPALFDRLPEFDDMYRTCWAMNHRMNRLAAVHRELAAACDQLAAHIDEVHSAITDELVSLAEWTAGIECGGALLSIVTFGGSEGGAQAAEAARVGKTAATVTALIERFIAAARTVAATVGTLAARADEIAAELVGVREIQLTSAVVWSVRGLPPLIKIREFVALSRLSEAARGLPALTVSASLVQKKFKHAIDFGVALKNGKPGWEAFQTAVADFVDNPTTVRLSARTARYRTDPAILNYNPRSGLVVIQHPDGLFWSCWRMTPRQLRRVRTLGILGHG